MPNIFTDSDVCELGVTFMASGRKFSYDFKYDAERRIYMSHFRRYLKISTTTKREFVGWKKILLVKYTMCIDESVQTMISVVSKKQFVMLCGRYK